MAEDDQRVTKERAEALFEQLISVSEAERSEALKNEPASVARLVLKLFDADVANAHSDWLESPPSRAVSLLDTTSEDGDLDGDNPFHFMQSSVAPRYDLHQVLGSGGFGVVYLALDKELKRKVAIKFVKSHVTSVHDPLAEAQAVANIDHPNIVPVFDVGRFDAGLYIVAKLIRGKSLAEIVRSKAIPMRSSVKIVAQIADAVYCAHKQGVVHRDIKPSNILLEKNRAYLCDFGLALREEDRRTSSGFAGTVQYMSPEQARGESEFVDGRSDIYSLGVVLYELLVGRRPFKGKGMPLLEQIATFEVTPPRQFREDISIDLEAICLKALSRIHTERYSTAIEFAAALRDWLRADKLSKQTVESVRTPPVFVASFHPIGAFSAVVAEMLKHPFLAIIFLPSILQLLNDGDAGLSKGVGSSRLWLFGPTILMVITPIIAAAFKCFTTQFEGKGGRLVLTSGVISRVTHEIAICDLSSIQLVQDAFGKRFGFGTLKIQGSGTYQTIDGVRNPQGIRDSLEPFLDRSSGE